jgi:GT2 family glycosyltransferase
MRDVLAADQNIGAVGAIQLSPDESTIDGLGDRLSIGGLPRRIAFGEPAKQVASYVSTNPYDPIFSPCAAVALYRRSAIREVGQFDEDYFCYCEDVDLGFRLRLAGYECVRANQAFALHAGSASTGQHSDFSIFHGHRNLVWNFAKNMPGALLIALMIPHLAINLGSILYFAILRRPAVMSRAKLAALRGLPNILRKRPDIHQHRNASASEIFKVLS